MDPSEGSGTRELPSRGDVEEATLVNAATSDAFTLALRLCERAPEDPASWDRVEQAARAHPHVERVFALYRSILWRDLPPATLLMLGERAVRFHEEWDEDEEDVLVVLLRLLEIEPTLKWAFDRASLQLTMLGRWEDLLSLYDGAIAVADGERRLALLDEAAHVAKDGACQVDRAIDYLWRLFEIGGHGPGAAEGVDRLLAQQGRHEDRIRLWQQRAHAAEPAEAVALALRIARCHLEDLDDPDRALAACEALDGRAAPLDGVLEIVERVAVAASSNADTRRRALEWLGAHLDAAGRGVEMMRILDQALTRVRGEPAVRIHAEMARRLAVEGRPDQAVEHLAAVVAHDRASCDDPTVERLLDGTFDGTLAGCCIAIDGERARQLLHRAARVAAIAGEHGAERAAQLYGHLLGHAPDDLAAIAGLAEIHRARGARPELLRLREQELRFTTDRARRLAIRLEIAQLHVVLGDAARGVAVLHDNLAEDADHDATIDALGRLHAGIGSHAHAVTWFERSLAMAPAGERSDRTTRLARAHVAAGHTPEALTVLEDRLRDQPEDASCRALLLELRRAGEDGEALVSTLIAASTYGEGAARRALLREASDVLACEIGAYDQAAVLLARLVADDAGDLSARAALADVLRRAGQWEEARAIAEALVGLFGRRHGPERSAMHLLLARVARWEQDDDEAMRQLELACTTDVRNVSAHRLLGKLAAKLGQLERAERAFQVLLQLQRRGLARSPREGAAFAVSETLFELHRIATRLGDSFRASETLASAFEAARAGGDEALRLEHALRQADMKELLLRALSQRLTATSEPAARAEILDEVCALQESLGQRADALRSALQAIALTPTHDAIHARARALSARTDDGAPYVHALQSLVAEALGRGDGKLGSALLLRLGEVHEHDLGQLDDAAAAYQRAEDTSENLVAVWRAMASVAARRDDRSTRLSALRKIADSPELDLAQRAETLYVLADLELESPDSTEAGLATLQLALATDASPRHADAARSLRKALQVSIDREPVIHLYEAVAREAADDAMLLEALWAASTLPRPAQPMLKEAVALAGRLGASERSVRLLERAVEAARESSADRGDALWAMRELAERWLAAHDLDRALVWMSRAADAADAEESRELLMRAATLAAGPAADPDVAIQSYERVLERDPGDLQAWEGLLVVLRGRAGEDPTALELALRRGSGEVRDPAARNRLRMELASLLVPQIDRAGEAREVLRAVLEEDPEHREAATMLGDLLQQTGDDAALAELLGRQLDLARDRGDQRAGVALALRLGRLHAAHGSPEENDVYRCTLAWVCNHPRLMRRLLSRLDAHDDAAERAGLAERILAHVRGPRRMPLALELFDASRELEDGAGIEHALQMAREIQPGAPELREPMRWFVDSLLAGGASPPAALPTLTLLVGCLSDLGDRETAIGAVEATIERAAPDDPDLGERFALRASLCAEYGDHESAVADLEQAMSLDGDRWLSALQSALARARRSASDVGDLDSERHLVIRQSELLGRSGENAAARALLTELVDGSFYDREVTEHLLALDLTAERWDEVARGCRKLLDHDLGPELVNVALLMADVCDALGRGAEARRDLERAHDYAPDDEAVRQRLRTIYEQTEDWTALATLLLEEAQETADEEARFRLLRQAGRLRLRRTDTPASAIGPLSEAAALRPADHEVTLLLADALIAAGLVDDAARLLDAAISGHGGKRSPDLASLQHRMSRVASERAPAEQLSWLVTAFNGCPKNVEIATDLATVATEQRQYDLALRGWRAVIAAAEGSPMVRANAYVRQARLAQLQGDLPRAMVLARRARSEHPQLAEVSALLGELGVR